MLLSILICSVPERFSSLQKLYTELWNQVKRSEEKDKVEILCFMDNRKRSVGEKRQQLLQLAKGDYVVMCDDDDEISNDYVISLLEAIKKENADVITFTVQVTLDQSEPKPCYYSIRFRDMDLPDRYLRRPNHLSCFKRSIALKEKYQSLSYGEDFDYASRILKHIKTETVLPKVLYYYKCITNKGKDWYASS